MQFIARHIDVLIPLSFGVLLVLMPELFFKKKESADQQLQQASKYRTIGLVLLAAAGLIFISQLGSRPATP